MMRRDQLLETDLLNQKTPCMSLDFEKYAAKGNAFVRLVADELDAPRARAGRVISSVLHAIRSSLPTEDSLRLLGLLPFALKSVYVDGWAAGHEKKPVIHLNDFLARVMNEDADLALCDFGDYESEKEAVASVFRVLNYFVSDAEMAALIDTLPLPLHAFVRNSIGINAEAVQVV